MLGPSRLPRPPARISRFREMRVFPRACVRAGTRPHSRTALPAYVCYRDCAWMRGAMKRCGRENRLKTKNSRLIPQSKHRIRRDCAWVRRRARPLVIAVPQDLGPAVPAALAALAAAPAPEARRHASRALAALSGRAR